MKEIHDSTKCSVDFIYKILEDAYTSGLKYDVSDMKNDILAFAAQSTHQSEYCIGLVNKMKFHSEEPSANKNAEKNQLIFFDVEVFPNLFLVNWKFEGSDVVNRMINPTSSEIEELTKYKLIGYNCRRYDNHIMYARLIGMDNANLYDISQRIVNGDKTAFFGEAYNMSYTDIYDYASKNNLLRNGRLI